MDGNKRSDIRPGLRVLVVQKRDQGSGRLTEGVVQEILTNTMRRNGKKKYCKLFYFYILNIFIFLKKRQLKKSIAVKQKN